MRISMSKKLTVAGLVVTAVTGYMAWLGASSSWQYYMTVKECVDHAQDMAGQRVRLSGTIAPDSLIISPDRREARFSLTETGSSIPVVCKCTLPDNLVPGKAMDVVVEGRLQGGCTFQGDKLITRCASKYEQKKTVETADRRAGEPLR
jgi:cytochrome c-type biogenesis protein CcmE